MEFTFQRHRIDKFSRQKLLEELERVARIYDHIEFSRRDFNKVANISAGPVTREFGGWEKTLEYLRIHLKSKNIDLSPRSASPNRIHSDKELFDEMERIWKELGHRPSRTEWNSINHKISYQCYTQRFQGWTNACLKFIEYKMGKLVILDKIQRKNFPKKSTIQKQEDKREIPLKLRLSVLKRDNFRCIFCGKSPATDISVILHIDHKVPFSKGGKTEIGNLQTLCSDCNLGKSNA